ncbi:MAG: PspC domain-containing protein [Actinomycetota bacterium]
MDRGRLYRSRTDRQIGGVCGGLAEYFDIDVTLVRVAFVVAAFTSIGLLAYIVLWIAVPEGTPDEIAPPPSSAAVKIAEERYARGEISADELVRIRADLEGRS